MNREELLQTITNIGTCEDVATQRSMLLQVGEEVGALFDTNESLTTANTQYQNDIKELQEHNMKLYLQVGGQQKKSPVDGTGNEEPKNLKYEDLFNEKGELK